MVKGVSRATACREQKWVPGGTSCYHPSLDRACTQTFISHRDDHRCPGGRGASYGAGPTPAKTLEVFGIRYVWLSLAAVTRP